MDDSYVEYDFDPRNLPQEYLAAIGLAVSAASQTNRVLADAIAGYAGIDAEFGAAMTTHMMVPLRISALKSLATMRMDDLEALDRLDVILAKLKTALESRNSQAHDLWCRHPQTGQVYRLMESARKHYTLALEPASIDEIKLEATIVYKVGIELQEFLLEHGFEPALPQVRQRGHNTPEVRAARRKAMGK